MGIVRRRGDALVRVARRAPRWAAWGWDTRKEKNVNSELQRGGTIVRLAMLVVVLFVGCAGASTPAGTATATTSASVWPEISFVDSATGSCKVVEATKLLSGGGDQDWSHATDRIVYDFVDAKGIFQVSTMDSSGSAQSCLSCTPTSGMPAVNQHKFNPSWHPGGEYFVVQVEMKNHWLSWLKTQPMTTEILQNGLWNDLYLVSADGTSWQKLTSTTASVTDGVLAPVFSPDGTKLMWSKLIKPASKSEPFGVWRLMLADFALSGGTASLANIRDITPDGARFIESHGFSVDSRSVIFTTDIGVTSTWEKHIWSMDLESRSTTNLTPNGHWNEHAYFSPDGSKISFMSSLPFLWSFLKTEVMLMNPDGTGVVRLTHFNTAGYPESNTAQSAATRIRWNAAGTKMLVTQQMADTYPARSMWLLTFAGACGLAAGS